MSFLLSLPPSRRRCFALVVSDCHRKVISNSDGHSIVKVHRGITHSASKPFWSWIKSPLTIQLGNIQVIIKNFLMSPLLIADFFEETEKWILCIFLFPLKTALFPSFFPFTSSELGRSFWQVFFEKIFLLKTRKPPKSLINRAFSAVKFFWIFSSLIAKRQKIGYNYRKGQLMIW